MVPPVMTYTLKIDVFGFFRYSTKRSDIYCKKVTCHDMHGIFLHYIWYSTAYSMLQYAKKCMCTIRQHSVQYITKSKCARDFYFKICIQKCRRESPTRPSSSSPFFSFLHSPHVPICLPPARPLPIKSEQSYLTELTGLVS